MSATSTEQRLISLAMGILGRRGGLAKSAAKKKAARENGKKGGRPRGALGTKPWPKPLVMTRMAIYQRNHRARVAAAKAAATE